MCIDHSGSHIFMAKQFLYGADVLSGLQEMGGETMSQRVASPALSSCLAHGRLDRLLQCAFVQMMPLLVLSARIYGPFRCGKNLLPGPVSGRGRQFARQRIG